MAATGYQAPRGWCCGREAPSPSSSLTFIRLGFLGVNRYCVNVHIGNEMWRWVDFGQFNDDTVNAPAEHRLFRLVVLQTGIQGHGVAHFHAYDDDAEELPLISPPCSQPKHLAVPGIDGRF
jgi:hypothetical protein